MDSRTKSLISPDNRSDMKTPFMSPAKSLRSYGIYGSGVVEGIAGITSVNEEDDGNAQRGGNRDRKGPFEGIGGSMGPLLNGAWAYQT